ncbi:MAG TPA: choice-of-anchor Q domain-containing protein, partial [Solirubrobacteraceae bacterium]|nr:choice-of-anchor Q domain-containing protein [Solirubrobacteraceae bacterium]
VTIAGNAAGDGGDGGQGLGATNGGQGASTPGQGAVGGDAGDLLVARANLALLHDTIVAGQVGAPGADYGGAVTASPGGGPGILYSHLTTTMTVAKSIIAGCAGDALGDLGFNLGSGGCPGSGADPQLGALQDNGGPTQTMRPAAGSPAVDAVPSNLGCAASDQRGVPRPVGIACDIGAVEFAAPTTITGDYSGLTINGTADGHGLSTKVSFEYGPTTDYGSSLTAGTVTTPGVKPFSATLPAMEPGTYHYRLVATNTDGTSAGVDHPLTVTQTVQPPPKQAPVISKLSFKPRRLKRGHRATVRFTITTAASVKLSFAKRKGKRYRPAGSLTRRVNAGRAKLTFRRRALKPGRYRLTLVATDVGGQRSKPVRATFRVVAA